MQKSELIEMLSHIGTEVKNHGTTGLDESGILRNDSVGNLIYYTGIVPPFAHTFPPSVEDARNADGSLAPFHQLTQEGNVELGEVNISIVQGQWFDYNFNNRHTSAPYLVGRAGHYIEKAIHIGKFFKPVHVKVTVSVSLPPKLEQVCKLERGTGDRSIESCGVTAKVLTEIATTSGPAKCAEKLVLESVRSDGLDDYDFYEPESSHDVWVKLPAGSSEINFRFWLIGSAFTSSDAADLTPGTDHAIAVLDLRSKNRNEGLNILADPLNGIPYPPHGGAKVSVQVAIYEVKTAI
ncbi:hypothetical protein [Dyadobacter sp. CY323]|uniref:hypothetical protein n=1 Tax=Dyadobacter sp. CY323 TaxID=2907302 RepID=UPI001F2F62D7|nr:hypothetical protein [Dyadobacter sp. CY323]MCE6989434.1 hypothetical protein [Dyadobacter sp. CY323]